MKSDEIEIDIIKLLLALKKNFIIIGLFAIVTGLLGVYYCTISQKIMYSSTSKVYLINNSYEDPFYTSDEIESTNKLLKDFLYIAKSKSILNEVLDNLNIDPLSYHIVSSCISINNPDDTRIVEFTVRNADPEFAKDLVDEMVYVCVKRIPKILHMNTPKVYEQGSEPTLLPSKSRKLYGVLGVGAGGFMAFATVIMLELFDTRVKRVSDLENNFACELLGVIPYQKEKRHIFGQKKERTRKRNGKDKDNSSRDE